MRATARSVAQALLVGAATISQVLGQTGFNTFAILAGSLSPPPKPKPKKPSIEGWIAELEQWKADK